ncbi:hypothetical protein pipiens_012984 [Culex pipiens pipiens]|uniref:Ig-like domain-containing protein n=1 Tax=Culex pipiens pipiens TaxID=38569 RepID=A0ABD1D076_CULPP
MLAGCEHFGASVRSERYALLSTHTKKRLEQSWPMRKKLHCCNLVGPTFPDSTGAGQQLEPRLPLKEEDQHIRRVLSAKQQRRLVVRKLNGRAFNVVKVDDHVLMVRTESQKFVPDWDGESVEISKISRLDMGAYLCIASNGVPPTVSKRIKVSVDCK